MAISKLDQIIQLVENLSVQEKRLLYAYVSALQPGLEAVDSFSESEIDAMLAPKETLTGRQIVEKHLKSGAIGSWADLDIDDSLSWLETLRAKRRNKFQW